MTNRNTDLNLTAEAWAEIVIDNWLDKISKLNIGYSFQLERNFIHEIARGPNGVPTLISFSFPYYGKFVDMGVGKGVRLEDVKSGASDYRAGEGGHRRRPKKWYSPVFYAEVQKLTRILAEKYALMGSLAIVENIDDNALRWNPAQI
jgi:hypothetical protein